MSCACECDCARNSIMHCNQYYKPCTVFPSSDTPSPYINLHILCCRTLAYITFRTPSLPTYLTKYLYVVLLYEVAKMSRVRSYYCERRLKSYVMRMVRLDYRWWRGVGAGLVEVDNIVHMWWLSIAPVK